jgi:hypothetical protein
MSSEMRELIAKWRSELLDLPVGDSEWVVMARSLAKNYNCALNSCADELEALLARTEAGADGAVAFRIALGDCIWQDRVFHAPSHDLAVERGTPIEYAYTHPQDASGDAEYSDRIADLIGGSQTPVVCEDGDANCTLWDILANAFGDDDIGNAREWVRETVYHAMQAKEAK